MNVGLSSNSIYEDEEYLWFSDIQFNGFYRVDKKTKEAELLFRFPEEEMETPRLYNATKKVGDYFVFCPLDGKNIVLYHEKTKEVKTIALKEPSQNNLIPYNEKSKFVNCLLGEENQLYFIPLSYPSIVLLDMTTFTLEYFDVWREDFASYLEQSTLLTKNYFGHGIQHKTSLFIPCRKIPYVMEFHLQRKEMTFHFIEGKTEGFFHLLLSGEEMYLLPQQGGILTKWNPQTHQVEEIVVTETTSFVPLWFSAFTDTEVLYLMPITKILPYQVDLSTGSVKRLDYFQNFFEEMKEINLNPLGLGFMLAPSLQKNRLHFVCNSDYRFYQVDLETGEFTSFLVEPEDEGRKILEKKSLFFRENINISLGRFIDLINDSVLTEEKKEEETVGSKILKETTK